MYIAKEKVKYKVDADKQDVEAAPHEEEKTVDVYQGQDHKRGPAAPPRPIFQSESTQLIEDIDQ